MGIFKPNNGKLILTLFAFIYPFLANFVTALPGLDSLHPALLFPYIWFATLFFSLFNNTNALLVAQL